MPLNPLLPITRESSFRSSTASHSFSRASPQYNFEIILIYKNLVKLSNIILQIDKIWRKNNKINVEKHLFLPSSSVKSVENFHIHLHIILLQNLDFPKLNKRYQSYQINQNTY